MYNKIEQWDSIGHMTLISDLEDKFKIDENKISVEAELISLDGSQRFYEKKSGNIL